MWENLMDQGHLEVLVYTYFESNETKLKDVWTVLSSLMLRTYCVFF
jgi:hypothetical protein